MSQEHWRKVIFAMEWLAYDAGYDGSEVEEKIDLMVAQRTLLEDEDALDDYLESKGVS